MKPKEILSNTPDHKSELIDEIGENHVGTSAETPLRKDAFMMSDEEKIRKIKAHFTEILKTLGLDLQDDSLKGTPDRVAKMFVKEVFKGLDPQNEPEVTLFNNKYGYDQMLVQKNIGVFSFCEHHFLPIVGKAHVAYFTKDKVIGLSKINRLVDHYARRPQVQERMTKQISQAMQDKLLTPDVAVVIEAAHMCVSARGVGDIDSETITSSYSGKFEDQKIKEDFLKYIRKS